MFSQAMLSVLLTNTPRGCVNLSMSARIYSESEAFTGWEMLFFGIFAPFLVALDLFDRAAGAPAPTALAYPT